MMIMREYSKAFFFFQYQSRPGQEPALEQACPPGFPALPFRRPGDYARFIVFAGPVPGRVRCDLNAGDF